MNINHRYLLRLWAVIIAFVLVSLTASAQKFFRSYYKTQGLCDNSVCCIKQDSNGFLWIGTFNGLSRFDGNSFVSFFHDGNDDSTISNSVVRALCPVDNGIWIATDDGISFYSLDDGKFHHAKVVDDKGKVKRIEGRFNHIVKTSQGILALSSMGDMLRCVADDIFKPVGQHKYGAIATFRDDMVVAVGSDGVYLLDDGGETVVNHLPMNGVSTAQTNIYYSKNKNSLFVGYGIGYKSLAFKIENNRIMPGDEYVPDGLMSTVDYGAATVFGIDGGGVVFDNGIERMSYNPYNSNIGGDAVYTLFVDRQENLWIGTYRMGLNLYNERFRWFSILNRSNHQLSYDIVTSIVPTDQQLYIGLDGGGLELYDRINGSNTTFTTFNSELPGNNITSMIDDGDRIWMTVYTKGLVCYYKSTHKFRTFLMPMTRNDAQNLWTLADDGKGNIWLCGPDVFVFNKMTEKITRVDINSAYSMGVAVKKNSAWLACRYQGLVEVDLKTKKVLRRICSKTKDIALPNDNVCFLYRSHDGALWLTVEHSGFYRLDEKKHTIVSYGLKEGLEDTNVTSMREDAQGNIVVGTYDGLFLMAHGTEKFIRLNVDGDAMEFTYNSSASYGNTTFFGTTKGLIYFDISKIKLPKSSDEVFFLSLELLNDHKTFDLYTSSVDEEITLSHDENFFTIRFSTPDFVPSNRIVYSCKLEGFDTKWREVTAGTMQYTKVPPGDYKFLVRATSDGINWSKPKSLAIVVTPPWYLSWWAELLWTIIVIVIVVVAVRAYLHELAVRHKMELTEVEKESERKLNDAKMNFYTSITHELRTPVFLITAQLEEILDEAKATVRVPSSYLKAIHRNASRLSELINRVVDFRKVGAENLQLSLYRADVVQFLKSKTNSYTEMFSQKRISYEFRSTVDELWLDYDPLKLELIISNLISNAFKYTKEGGRVLLAVSDERDRVVFTVRDNGIGIDERYRDTIFESFFRSERGKKQGKGDGLGLSYVKNFVKLHGGEITVDSVIGKGSIFTFYIPKRETESHAKPALLVDSSVHKDNPAALHSILIVDDERETVDLLMRYLEKEFRVMKAYDGEEGLRIAGEALPDLVLCDIMMSKMDGLQFLHCLKTDKKLQHIKVIMFTAKTAEDDMLSAFDNGADAYLTKPISLKLLRKRIDKLIGQDENAGLMASVGNFVSLASSEGEQLEKKKYTKEQQAFLLRCREIIDDNLQNPDFNINFLADAMTMSHSALYKKIKTITDMSPIEFVNDYKIYKAVQLFRQGETNVETVADACGINDVKNFRTMFKRKMLVTPKQFVQNL